MPNSWIQIRKMFTINEGGCWVSNKTHPNGYGYLYFEGEWRGGHNIILEIMGGKRLRKIDLTEPDHLCRNRGCWNPFHLEEVTRKENYHRAAHPPNLNTEKTHCINGHVFDQLNTYIDPKTGYRYCKICRQQNRIKSKNKKWFRSIVDHILKEENLA